MRDYVAIFDIGSNAVRLVVYDSLSRAPVKIHNERNVCGLGASLATTGRLDPDGLVKAMASLQRFSALVRAMKIRHVHAVATAAVRDAQDGAQFIEKIRDEFGLDVLIVEGKEEARLSALGVLAGGLGADGLIGDYGGGSLELILLDGRKIKHATSLPIGSLRLHPLQGKAAKIKVIDKALDQVDFLPACLHKDFTALGGAWRSMAKAHMHLKKHPLRMIDHYAIDGAAALEFSGLVARQSPASLENAVGFSKRRVRDVAVGALVLERLLVRLQPKRLIFSASGLREGLLYDQLPPSEQKRDALIAAAEKFALRESRFEDLKAFHGLRDFVSPLFVNASDAIKRLVSASCVLSDIAGFEHEDFQAEQAFHRVFTLPLHGIDHAGRAFLALAQYVRYKGYLRRAPRAREGEDVTFPAQKMLDDVMIQQVVILGQALRLGYLLTGGALDLLRHAAFKITPQKLSLILSPAAGALDAEATKDALHDLAASLAKEAGGEK